MTRLGLVSMILLVLATATPAFGLDAETRQVRKILETTPAVHYSTVWKVMRANSVKLREGQINTYPVAVPSQSIAAGDTMLEIFFDVLAPSTKNLSREATHNLHARFVKHQGSTTWTPANGWAEAFVSNKMPWKEKQW